MQPKESCRIICPPSDIFPRAVFYLNKTESSSQHSSLPSAHLHTSCLSERIASKHIAPSIRLPTQAEAMTLQSHSANPCLLARLAAQRRGQLQHLPQSRTKCSQPDGVAEAFPIGTTLARRFHRIRYELSSTTQDFLLKVSACGVWTLTEAVVSP